MITMTEKTVDPYFEKILAKVHKERNLDFSQYREKLLMRRIMVRLRAIKETTFEKYFTYLTAHPSEMDQLVDVLTINVTEFFRDPDVFDVIETRLIPELFERKRALDSRVVRIWSCGCSSGQEAYSILMLIAEYLGAQLPRYQLSIYGTDIDTQSLARAKEGIYEASGFKNLAPRKRALLAKYFYDMGHDRYWIREEWPKYITFQYHDMIAEPVLRHMDMILCRNVMIYFDRPLQDQVIQRFWTSLQSEGFLVLGKVEGILGWGSDHFTEYDRKARIYIKK